MQVGAHLGRISYTLTACHLQHSALCGSGGTKRPEVACTGRARCVATAQVLDTCSSALRTATQVLNLPPELFILQLHISGPCMQRTRFCTPTWRDTVVTTGMADRDDSWHGRGMT